MDRTVDVAIIGAGTAGLYSLREVRKVTTNFVVINGGHDGTTCARVGCMPSKVLVQAAEDFHRRTQFNDMGIRGGEQLQIDIPAVLKHVRKLRDNFVGRVLGNVSKLGDKKINGYAEFVEPTVLKVNGQHIQAKKVIIATGSTPVIPQAWQNFEDKILTTDQLFEQEDLPPKMAVLGLGVIGLEIGQALARLGIQLTGIDMLTTIAGLQDPQINQVAIELMQQECSLWLGKAAEIRAEGNQLRVQSGEQSVVVDKVLASLGRRPNLAGLGLEKLGCTLDKNSVPMFNSNTMQIDDLPVFIAGDANGERALLHEASDEGRIAGFNAVHDDTQFFKRKPKFGITFCDPNIVAVGEGWSTLQTRSDIAVGEMNFQPQGRALIMGKNKGLMRVYGQQQTGKLLGAEMIVPKGENLGHLLVWAIQQEMTVFDLLKMTFYHPVVEEGLQNALADLASKVDSHQQTGIPELDYL